MALDLSDKTWLEALVASELDGHDPDAVRERLPDEVRARLVEGAPAVPDGELVPLARVLVSRSLRQRRLQPTPEETFEDAVRGHVQLALELALVAGARADADARRAAVAAILAAAAGVPRVALAADPAASPKPRNVVRALRTAGSAFAARSFPPADPVGGLPLFPGGLAANRRLVAR
ncbi:MAG TPA: hypothetical protein VD838_07310, partial [Anaeromyxobacteraceae bacterium]|nr:hypothetical protein [Anaeromyxobacteraceae bacterium]